MSGKRIDERLFVIRHPSSQGATVAKFDGGESGTLQLPHTVVDHDAFIVQSVSPNPALGDRTVDQSGLSEDGMGILEQVYPTDQ